MEKDVYVNDSVGNILNQSFISVKVQMDTSKKDGAYQVSWYEDAGKIARTYKVNSLPTYLFFSPEGELVHRDFGYKPKEDFLGIVAEAKDPARQYDKLYADYKAGKKEYATMPYLINKSKMLGDKEGFNLLLTDYYNHLSKMSTKKLYTKEHIEFVASTIDKSSRQLFSMFYPDGKRVDAVMDKKGYAGAVVSKLIEKEKTYPFLAAAAKEKVAEPEWAKLHEQIRASYGTAFADRNLLDAKILWYIERENSQLVTQYLNQKMVTYGSDTTDMGEDFRMNNMAFFMVLQDVSDTAELNKTIGWMYGVVNRAKTRTTAYHHSYWPMYLDTYANLLYKAGRTEEALKWQEEAIKGAEEMKNKGWIKEHTLNYEKMKKGEPTWRIKK